MDGAIQSGWRAAVEVLEKMNVKVNNPEDEIQAASPVVNLAPDLCENLLDQAIAAVKKE